MTRGRQAIRRLALTAAVLLVWCHGLDVPFHGHAASGPPSAAMVGDTMLAAPAPAHPERPAVSCCFGGTGSNLLAVTMPKAPTVAEPLLPALLAALLSGPLLLAAWRPVRALPRRLAAHRASLVEQAVLIRI